MWLQLQGRQSKANSIPNHVCFLKRKIKEFMTEEISSTFSPKTEYFIESVFTQVFSSQSKLSKFLTSPLPCRLALFSPWAYIKLCAVSCTAKANTDTQKAD